MKKVVLVLLLFGLLFSLPLFMVSADTGPKQTLDIEIIGIPEDTPYFFDILKKGTVPDQTFIDELISTNQTLETPYEIPEMLFSFYENGYVSNYVNSSWHLLPRETSPNTFIHAYNPPSDLKLIIIFEEGHFITSNPITTTLFNSKIIWDLSDVNLTTNRSNAGTIVEVLPIRTMTIELVIRIISTLAIEIAILFLFGYTFKKSFSLVILVNLFTQLSLTLFLFLTKYYYNPGQEYLVLTIGEALVFGIEILIFMRYLKEHTKKRALLYTLTANVFSLIASLSIMILMINI